MNLEEEYIDSILDGKKHLFLDLFNMKYKTNISNIADSDLTFLQSKIILGYKLSVRNLNSVKSFEEIYRSKQYQQVFQIERYNDYEFVCRVEKTARGYYMITLIFSEK